MTAPAIDERRAVDNLLSLLAVEGLSGRETRVAEKVANLLVEAGCRPEWIAHDSAHRKAGAGFECGNLIVRLPGKRGLPRVMFSGHMDTVPLCRGAEPVRRGGRIESKGETGLGADNRTAVAAIVTAAQHLLGHGIPRRPLTLLFTVAEEVGLCGARYVTKKDLGHPSMGFNLDGGDPAKLIVGAIGATRWTAEIRGRSSHAGVHPEQGISAGLIASRAVADLAERGWFGAIGKSGGRGTANVGKMNGGMANNQVMDHMTVTGECRSHSRKFLARITSAWRTAFERAAVSVRNHEGQCGSVSFEFEDDYEAFRLNKSAPVVREAQRAADATGLTPETVIMDGGLDASFFNQRGIPTVTLGAGAHAIHTTDEYADLDEYLAGCRLLMELARA
ncbi:M20/M25/M40 family metallo-hydrolase [Kiritimatiella glycovorans]|uniref:Peptidase T n=1 Tax=Kiritimatiella glycovorans TaxID=1307763 RepID=A0A0G3EIU3_9BACT|nr:M20/M25/M40 family metallo-hydrolase [Kiritimatiella glycovorans]AKJ65322.1 Peptidase T [Kiritimatiella glycovorans]